MDADNDRLNSKLQGATVIDLDAARAAKARDTSMPFVDGLMKTVTLNWVFIALAIFAWWILRRAR